MCVLDKGVIFLKQKEFLEIEDKKIKNLVEK